VLTAGSLADRIGRKRFAIGLVLFTAASAACGFAGSIDVLDAARAVQGIGAAMLFVSLALIAGAVLLASFVLVELTRPQPMLPLHLFRLPNFAGAQLSVFTISCSVFAIYLYLSLYLQGTLGRSPIETGLAYLPGSILMFFVSGATPKLGAKIGSSMSELDAYAARQTCTTRQSGRKPRVVTTYRCPTCITRHGPSIRARMSSYAGQPGRGLGGRGRTV
jgi:predicted MFS family arabinose efflux permease